MHSDSIIPCVHTVRARVNMCDMDPAALLRAQNTCVYVTSHLIHPQHGSRSRHVPQPASPRSAQCESMECADVPDVSNAERNDDLSSTVPSETPWQCKPEFSTDKMVGDNKNLTARCRWSRTVSVPAGIRSVMVALGVFAGLTPSVGARQHQQSLLGGLHL